MWRKTMIKNIIKSVGVAATIILLATGVAARTIIVNNPGIGDNTDRVNDIIPVEDLPGDNTVPINNDLPINNGIPGDAIISGGNTIPKDNIISDTRDILVNSASIQDVVNSAESGDVIKIGAGTFSEPILINKDIHLIGDGVDATFIEYSGTEHAIIVADNVADVIISGISILYTGSVSDDSVGGIWVRNAKAIISNNMIMGTGHGILCTNGAEVQIFGNEIIGTMSHGIVAYPGTSVTKLSDNKLMDNVGDGLHLKGTTIRTLADNIIQNNGEAGAAIFDGTKVSQFSNNEITGNGGGGLYIVSATIESMTGNTIGENQDNGISAFAETKISDFSSNNVFSNERYGIYLESASIQNMANNVIQGNGDIGIVAFAETQINKLTGNRILENAGRGINLDATKVESLDNNIIRGNEHGLVATGGTEINQLAQNQILANRGRGISLNSVAIAALTGNIIRDNRSDGLATFGSTWIDEVSWNLIDNNGQDAISLVQSGVGEILNNTIFGNDGTGIKLDGNLDIVAKNNIIVQNSWGVAFFQDMSVGDISPDLSYNNIWNNRLDNYGDEVRPDIMNIRVDPLFVDAEGRDFHLQASSLLIGAGENGVDIGAIPAVIRDIDISGDQAKTGEMLILTISAEPGASVSFSIGGVVFDVPMQELRAGTYQGSYTVLSSDRGIHLPVIIDIETQSGYMQKDGSQHVTLSGGIRSVQVEGSPAKADDIIQVTLLADAGGHAEFSLERVAYGIPMDESGNGTYTGSYRVQHGNNADNTPVSVLWIDKNGQHALDQSQTVQIDTVAVFAGSPVKAGEPLIVTAAGKAGNQITFSVPGISVNNIPMGEVAGQPGIYSGQYLIKPGDNVKDGLVNVRVKTPSGDSFINSTAHVNVDTALPEIQNIKVSKATIQNGGAFEITLASERNAIIAADISMVDTTQTLVILHEADNTGFYSREVTISQANEALNGKKEILITAIDPAGNIANAETYINLSNISDPTDVMAPEAFLKVQPSVLPADGVSAALVVASLGKKITDLSRIRLDAHWSNVTGSEFNIQNAGHLSDLQLVENNHVTATYTSGLLVGEVELTLTFLDTDEQLRTYLVLEPPVDEEFSQLSWDYLPKYTRMHQPMEISGQLTPPVGGEIVNLTIASPYALANGIISMHTDPLGRFSHVLVPDEEGIWSFQLSWAGNAFYDAIESNSRQLAVVINIPMTPLSETGWSRLTTAEGLASNQVNALAQDKDSRIWIGTDQGISVFDGGVSNKYTKANGLQGNNVTSLALDELGQMWIGSAPDGVSDGGLAIYDGFTWFHSVEKTDLSLNYVLALHQDRHGRMWIGGDGLTLFSGGIFVPIPMPTSANDYIISAFAEDMRGNLWIGTNIGLFRFQMEGWDSTSPVGWTHYTKEKSDLPSNNIQAVLVDSAENIWIGTFPELNANTQVIADGGLSFFNGQEFENFNAENSELPSNYVASLMEDNEGQILVGMLSGGVVRFGEWKPLIGELENRSVTSLLQDDQRQVWIGTDAGVHRSDRQSFSVWKVATGRGTFYQDKTGTIWAGSEMGLMKFDGFSWTAVQEFWNIPVYCIAQHDGSKVAVGSANGLAIFNGEAWTYLADINGIALGSVTALFSDIQRRTFLGTSSGAFMAWVDGSWSNLTSKIGNNGNPISDFAMDSTGDLWIGTAKGLIRYSWVEFTKSDAEIEITDLDIDKDGNLWAATHYGIHYFNGENWHIYSVQNSGIASDIVSSLAIDGSNRVWVGTDSGISRFDGMAFSFATPRDAWTTFTTQNSDLMDDNIRGLFIDTFREAWITTTTTVIRLSFNQRPPDTMITRAPVSTVGTASPFFEFIGADIESGSAELLYSYKVDSEEWSPYSRSGYIMLRHQENGVHTFYVRAMDKDSNHDPSPAQRSFLVDTTPPIVTIVYPAARQVVGKRLAIQGYAIDDSDFDSYTITVRNDVDRDIFSHKVQEPARNDVLALWDTSETEDGVYIIVLSAKDRIDGPDDEVHTSMTLTPVTVDNSRPTANIFSPTSNQSLSGVVSINGQASDYNMENVQLMWTQDAVIDESTPWQLIASEDFREPDANIEYAWDSSSVYGMTTIRLLASDGAGNTAVSDVTVQLENSSAKPTVSITSPVAEAVVAGIRRITGTASDSTFEGYRLEFSPDEQPTNWTEFFASPNTVTDDILGSWDTTAVSDGGYTLRLTAIDGNGYTSSVAFAVVVDNSHPVAVIYPPSELVRGRWIASDNVEIIGTATDANFDNYVVEFGESVDPTDWISIEGASEEQVQDDILRLWNTSGLNGDYTVRLMVTNEAGLSSEFRQPLILDNRQPEGTFAILEEGQFITGEVAVDGTAYDENLRHYQISIGQGAEPSTWEMLLESPSSRQDEVLYMWDTKELTGEYSIKIFVEDYTGKTVEDVRHVIVDNTPPQAEITAPGSGEMVSGNFGITGTAQDENFLSYTVEYAIEADSWEEIGGLAVEPVTNDVLRSWNTTTLRDGACSLKLTVTDKAEHTSIKEIPITIDNNLPVAQLTSPEEDQYVTGEITVIGTANDVNLRQYQIMIGKGEVPTTWKTLATGLESQQSGSLLTWNTAGLEGRYSIKLVVEDYINDPVEVTRHVTIDDAPPRAEISAPIDGAMLSGEINISGTANDEYFSDYLLEYALGANPADNEWKDIGGLAVQPITDDVLRSWNTATIDDGLYSLRLTVKDSAGHIVVIRHIVMLDNNPPEAELKVATSDGVVTGTVEILGTASDPNLGIYEVFIAPADEDNWELIGSGTESMINDVLTEWDTEGLEGEYSIRLVADDLSGKEPGEDIQDVIVDNTDPVALITSPLDNHQVGGVISLMGTASDANFTEYVVEFGEGASPQIWTKASPIAYRAPVESGELVQWFAGELSGLYTLRLTVTDAVGHTNAVMVKINILPPIAKAEGGERTSTDGLVSLYLPPRSLPGDTLVTINPVPEMEGAVGSVILGNIYELGPKDAKISSIKPATLSINYAGTAHSGNKTLVIAHFEGDRGVPVGGTMDTGKNTVTTAVNKFGRYALMELDTEGLQDSADIADLTCQPRIFSPNGSGHSTETTISFRLSKPTIISIFVYNRAGELVETLVEDETMSAGTNAIHWDGSGEDEILPSNMYVVTVKAGDQVAYKTVGIVNR